MKKIGVGLLICAAFSLAVNAILRHLTAETGGSGSPVKAAQTNWPRVSPKKTVLRPAPDANQGEILRAEQKVKVLREILSSRNDNDPRLDNEFVNLSEIEKEKLRQEYRAMPRENFNGKGTVVFLLGRNIKTSRDVAFLGGVLAEAPCANMTDCAKPAPALTPEAEHDGSVNQITLVYPQIVSLKSLEPYVDAPPADAALRQSVSEALRAGARSQNNLISKMARDYGKRFLNGAGG